MVNISLIDEFKKKKNPMPLCVKYKVHELANPLFKPPVVKTPSG